jgi:hypothetical protein
MEKLTRPVVQEKSRLPIQILTARQNRQLAFFGHMLISGQRPEVGHRHGRQGSQLEIITIFKVSMLRKWEETKAGSIFCNLY